MAIHLIIKSPNQQVDDITVDCDSTWNVGKLKEHLCVVYPTKPAKSQQKIIYGGRLLPDHLMIKDVITRDQDVHTMHLVCPQSTYSSKSGGEAFKAQTEGASTDATPLPPIPNVFDSGISTDGVRHRVLDPQQYMTLMNTFYSQAQMPQTNPVPTTPVYNAYQLATLQQTYAQFMAQCLAQGQQAYGMSSPNLVANPPLASTASNVPNAQPNLNQPAAAANPQWLNPNEAEDRFDFLDSLYLFTRVLMLTAVLYFYSTPGRIVLVLGLGILLCLYRFGAGRRTAQQNVPTTVVEERNQNVRPESDIGTNPSAADAETDQMSNDSESSSESEPPVTEEQPPPQPMQQQTTSNRPSKLEIAFVFVKTLFTSLIPDLPVPVDVN